jgi:hypothetical protein
MDKQEEDAEEVGQSLLLRSAFQDHIVGAG